VETVRLGELFDGLVRSFLQGTNPAMGADDGLDQALIMRAFRSTVSFHNGCRVPCLDRPGDFDFLWAIGGRGDRYNEVVASNDDGSSISAGLVADIVWPLMQLNGSKNGALDLCRRGTANRSGRCLPPPQQCRTDIEAITHAALAGKARAHEVAPVVIELALEQRAAFEVFDFAAIGVGLE